ncbi:MAG TPA: protoglobin domain-containing protein, partial [Pyrinomonadaceae bacterium]|nr:protoglobin domain-containing protein [Pyrinomonadaceae bacterium]
IDLCTRPYDQQWLDYQYEIGLRHHSTKKNKTDNVDAEPIIHYRYMAAFIYPITATIKPFLAKGAASAEDVEKMHDAWFKAVVLTVVLWTMPYIRDGEF